jgi:hypothetical protein
MGIVRALSAINHSEPGLPGDEYFKASDNCAFDEIRVIPVYRHVYTVSAKH